MFSQSLQQMESPKSSPRSFAPARVSVTENPRGYPKASVPGARLAGGKGAMQQQQLQLPSGTSPQLSSRKSSDGSINPYNWADSRKSMAGIADLLSPASSSRSANFKPPNNRDNRVSNNLDDRLVSPASSSRSSHRQADTTDNVSTEIVRKGSGSSGGTPGGMPSELIDQIEKALRWVSQMQQIREKQEQELLDASETGIELRRHLDEDRERYSIRCEMLGEELHEEQVRSEILRTEMHELRMQEAEALEHELDKVRLEARKTFTVDRKPPEQLTQLKSELATKKKRCEEIQEQTVKLVNRSERAVADARPFEEQAEKLRIANEQSQTWRDEEEESLAELRDLQDELTACVE